jgi:hypothetical protein
MRFFHTERNHMQRNIMDAVKRPGTYLVIVMAAVLGLSVYVGGCDANGRFNPNLVGSLTQAKSGLEVGKQVGGEVRVATTQEIDSLERFAASLPENDPTRVYVLKAIAKAKEALADLDKKLETADVVEKSLDAAIVAAQTGDTTELRAQTKDIPYAGAIISIVSLIGYALHRMNVSPLIKTAQQTAAGLQQSGVTSDQLQTLAGTLDADAKAILAKYGLVIGGPQTPAPGGPPYIK